MNEHNRVFFLRILYQLSLYRCRYQQSSLVECSCKAFLQDKEFCDNVKTMVYHTPQSTDEIKVLCNSITDCVLNGYQQKQRVIVQVVNPKDVEFGDPPTEDAASFVSS